MNEIDLTFQKSEEALQAAKLNLKEEFYSTSINRSYYAVFYAARALLLKKGKNPKKHSGTIAEFGSEYVINDSFDKKIGKLFFNLEKDRGNADYEISFESTEKRQKKIY